MSKFVSLLLLSALTTLPPVLQARESEKLADCVDLAAGYEVARFGAQYLLVKDGQDYYRVGFGGSCSAIALSSSIKISTEGQSNRLCPTETRVASKRDRCDAREVVRIDAHEYESYARKQR